MRVNVSLKKILVVMIGAFVCFCLTQNFLPSKAYSGGDLYLKMYKKCIKDYKKAKKKCKKLSGKKEYKCWRAAIDEEAACTDPDNIKENMYLKINKKTLKKIEKAQKKCNKKSGKQYKECSKLKTEDDRENCNDLVMNNTMQCAKAVQKKYGPKLKEAK